MRKGSAKSARSPAFVTTPAQPKSVVIHGSAGARAQTAGGKSLRSALLITALLSEAATLSRRLRI
jgi:hypothetical protein